MSKAPTEIAGIKRLPPRRTITKQQAARHLIHAATRMIAAAEDPFAIHLLVQSADKILTDLAKHIGKPLAHEWTDLIKPEYSKAFIQVFRETYNYFKHADNDPEETLHVGSIAESNLLQLAVCIANFHSLFGEWTDHMRLVFTCAKLVLPDGFVMQKDRAVFDMALPKLSDIRFGEFFNLDLWSETLLAKDFPNLGREREEDLQDNEGFFSIKIGDFPIRKH